MIPALLILEILVQLHKLLPLRNKRAYREFNPNKKRLEISPFQYCIETLLEPVLHCKSAIIGSGSCWVGLKIVLYFGLETHVKLKLNSSSEKIHMCELRKFTDITPIYYRFIYYLTCLCKLNERSNTTMSMDRRRLNAIAERAV